MYVHACVHACVAVDGYVAFGGASAYYPTETGAALYIYILCFLDRGSFFLGGGL